MNELDEEARRVFEEELYRFNQPKALIGDSVARNARIEGLELAFIHGGVTTPDAIKGLFRFMAIHNATSVWPERSEVVKAIALKGSGTDTTAPRRGDKTKLKPADRAILEKDILPRAREWVRRGGQLGRTGQRTLDFWNET